MLDCHANGLGSGPADCCFLRPCSTFYSTFIPAMVTCTVILTCQFHPSYILHFILYWEQSACVRTESGMISEFKIKKGVRQGCVLSPNLFNIYTEKIFREVEDMKGINIGGVNINNLRYADDIVLLAEGPMFLQALLTAVNEKGKPYGMEMNIIKTKPMVISRKKPAPKISISVEGKPIQQVDRMVYLGYMATEDGKCDKEIKRRIGIARTAFESMAKILTSRNISIE